MVKTHRHSRWATKKFRVSGSSNAEGPWVTLLEEELIHTLSSKKESLRNITFAEPVEAQYLKFDLVSFWGDGGGLQYFAAVPYFGISKSREEIESNSIVFSGCNTTAWTEWSLCCERERKRTRSAIRNDECKTIKEVESCSEDKCPGILKEC